jgi:hypothetical protein
MKIVFTKEEVGEILLDFVSRTIEGSTLNNVNFALYRDHEFAEVTYEVTEIKADE